MNDLIQDAQLMLFATYDAGLQRQMIVRLNDAMASLAAAKRMAVAERDEDRANMVLGFECVMTSLEYELRMWLYLKETEPDKAWTALVGAQDAAIYAARAHRGFSHLPHHLARLETLEHVLFPAQQFVSSGFVVGRQICSICEEDYDDCAHVATRPYWGEFCSVRQDAIAIDHLSLVETPASKLCRLTHAGFGKSRRNRMTGLPDPADDNTTEARIW